MKALRVVAPYTGEMAYYRSGRTTFPVQLSHEWTQTNITRKAPYVFTKYVLTGYLFTS